MIKFIYLLLIMDEHVERLHIVCKAIQDDHILPLASYSLFYFNRIRHSIVLIYTYVYYYQIMFTT